MAGTDNFVAESEEPTSKAERVRILNNQAWKGDSYDVDEAWKPGDPKNPLACKTIAEMMECLDTNPNVGIDGQFLAINPKTGARQSFKVTEKNRTQFLESFKRREKKFKESGSFDGGDYCGSGVNGGLVGDDFVPIMGGPFDKQLYYYDFMAMQSAAFWAYHHDPFAHAIVHIILDFTLGKGFRIDFEDKKQQANWEAFMEANDFENQFLFFAKELSIYGESDWWWLPNNQTQIQWKRQPGEAQSPTGIIPRIRVMDPSLFWDKITHPEDINTVLAYQWVAPTQYQIYTQVQATGERVASSKFIYRQIPGEEIIEQKINCVSNEKRGRSDLFSVLGYLKRLRDTVNWSIIGMQKAAAFCIDTTIQGGQPDIDAYISAQNSMGAIPPAGSEFVHTAKITREYLSNSATDGGGKSSAFEWCLNMVAAGSRIPVSYFGTHLSGGSTRASAIVATEPVAKLFESRQMVYDRTLLKIIKGWAGKCGYAEYKVKITWPEIITQDRSQKLKDLALAEQSKWFSPQRSAEAAAKELGADDYIWTDEQAKITEQSALEIAPGALQQPLTAPGKSGGGGLNAGADETKPGLDDVTQSVDKPSAVTGSEKVKIKKEMSQ